MAQNIHLHNVILLEVEGYLENHNIVFETIPIFDSKYGTKSQKHSLIQKAKTWIKIYKKLYKYNYQKLKMLLNEDLFELNEVKLKDYWHDDFLEV